MKDTTLVLSFFDDKAAAEAAVEGLKTYHVAEGDVVGVLTLDDKGDLDVERMGKRTFGTGAGIGLVLALVTPVGLAAGVVGGGLLGALHHKGLGLSDEERNSIAEQLKGGAAAVGVLAHFDETPAVSAALQQHGGRTKSHRLDDAALSEADQAAGG